MTIPTRARIMCICSVVLLTAVICSDVQAWRPLRIKRQETTGRRVNVEPKAEGGKKPKQKKTTTAIDTSTNATTTTRSTTTQPLPRGFASSVCGMGMCGAYCWFYATKRSFCDARKVCICGDDDDTRSDWPCNFYEKGCAIYCSMKGTDESMCNENNQCICTFGDEHYRPDNFPDNT